MSGARYFAKLRERQRDAQIKDMRERRPCAHCGESITECVNGELGVCCSWCNHPKPAPCASPPQ